MAEKTEFQRLYMLHIHRGCEALKVTQEGLAKRLGKSRQALLGATRVRCAISWSMLHRFCEEIGVTKDELRTIENEWILERICNGKFGAAIETILIARTTLTEAAESTARDFFRLSTRQAIGEFLSSATWALIHADHVDRRLRKESNSSGLITREN